jgi:hypothetical protein
MTPYQQKVYLEEARFVRVDTQAEAEALLRSLKHE